MTNTTDYPPKFDPAVEADVIDALDSLTDSLESEEASTEIDQDIDTYELASKYLEEAKKRVNPADITEENIHFVMDTIAKQIDGERIDPARSGTERIAVLQEQWDMLNDVKSRLGNTENTYDEVVAHYIESAPDRHRDDVDDETRARAEIAYNEFLTVIRQMNHDTKVYMSLPGLLARLK